MAGKYAQDTSVSPEKSRAEIETMLGRYGASSFGYAWDEDGKRSVIQFRAQSRMVRFTLEMPDPKEKRFLRSPVRGNFRTPEQARQAWEQATRQAWRALALVVKAKLEAVASGITTFEAEFLAHILLPDGTTMGQWATPQLDAIYASGQMPRGILMLTDGGKP